MSQKDSGLWESFNESFSILLNVNVKKLRKEMKAFEEKWSEKLNLLDIENNEAMAQKIDVFLSYWNDQDFKKLSETINELSDTDDIGVEEFKKLDDKIQTKLLRLTIAVISFEQRKLLMKFSPIVKKYLLQIRNEDMAQNSFETIRNFKGDAVFIQVGEAHREGIAKLLAQKLKKFSLTELKRVNAEI